MGLELESVVEGDELAVASVGLEGGDGEGEQSDDIVVSSMITDIRLWNCVIKE